MMSVMKRCLPVLLVAIAACHDKDTEPTLENLWPNADGTTWSYEYVQRTWDNDYPTVYATPADIPAPPTLEELAALLGVHEIGATPETTRATYSLSFDGTVTTQSGATGQRLASELGDAVPASRTDHYPLALLADLWIARPDLRERLVARGFSPPDGARDEASFDPLLLSGYAWARTDDWIGGYGDLDPDPAWIYLTAELKPGMEFTHQLVPAVTDDVFLHGRILPRQSVSTPAGTFDDVVVCLYLVDYGVGTVTNDSGGLLGYTQTLSYGTVAYARDVGPVSSYERVLLCPGNPLPPGVGDVTLELTSAR